MPKSFRELHLRAKLRGLVDLKPESLLQWVEIPVIADPTSTEYEDPFQQAFGNQLPPFVTDSNISDPVIDVLNPLKDSGGTHAATNTHRDHSIPTIPAL